MREAKSSRLDVLMARTKTRGVADRRRLLEIANWGKIVRSPDGQRLGAITVSTGVASHQRANAPGP
jgi:hypothetical protein